jgi:archaellum component FlaC
MLTKMSKEELIKYVEELQNDIEHLHAELRMVYKDLKEARK